MGPGGCNLWGYPHSPHSKRRDASDACPEHKWQDHGGWCYVCDLAFEDEKCKADHSPAAEAEAQRSARNEYIRAKRRGDL